MAANRAVWQQATDLNGSLDADESAGSPDFDAGPGAKGFGAPGCAPCDSSGFPTVDGESGPSSVGSPGFDAGAKNVGAPGYASFDSYGFQTVSDLKNGSGGAPHEAAGAIADTGSHRPAPGEAAYRIPISGKGDRRRGVFRP